MADIIKLNPADEQALEEGLNFCASSSCYGIVYLVNEDGQEFFININDYMSAGEIMEMALDYKLGLFDEDFH